MLFLTAVVLLCHLGDAEQLLVGVDIRRQLKDLFKNFLITVWSLQLTQLQGPQFYSYKIGSVKVGWNIIMFSENKASADKTDENATMKKEEK